MIQADDLQDSLIDDHLSALRWFEENEGSEGPRPWRRDGKPVVPDIRVPLTAQRGIHVPSGWKYALSVAATRSSQYGDGEPLREADGTWTYLYKAHRGADGVGIHSQWNRALIECWRYGVPVGVLRQLAGGQYQVMGLALVDAFYSEADTFLLRGPVALGRYRRSPVDAEVDAFYASDIASERWMDLVAEEELSGYTDRRSTTRTVLVRERQEDFRAMLLDAYSFACSVSGYDAVPALQAAHIVGYSGVSSHRPANGLLLRADLHVLFDRHLMAIDYSGGSPEVLVGPGLRGTRYEPLDRRPLRLPAERRMWPSPDRLEQHRLVFEEVAARAG